MSPVSSEVFVRGFSLSSLVLVMGELKVKTSTVKIEAFAKQTERHHDALGVPTWSPLAKGCGPARLVGLRVFPEREVKRRTLFVVTLDARSGTKTLESLSGQEAVVRDRGDVEI